MKSYFLAVLAPLFLATTCHYSGPSPAPAALVQAPAPTAVHPNPDPNKMQGLTFVAPPRPFEENPMSAVTGVGANWIAVIPYAFTRLGTPAVQYGNHPGKWWGESQEGVRESIRVAHEAGLKVMLKPQVYVPGSWPGGLDFSTTADWEKWEADYEKYILPMAAIAQETQADLFCIGTEFSISTTKRADFWRNLIQKIKKVYAGKLTYCSTWSDYNHTPFWADVDYIGISAYFPLVQDATPAVADLQKAWIPIRDSMRTYSAREKKPILFTEFGYLSVDSCGWQTWMLERGVEQRRINEQAQANCLEALFATFQPEPWWSGGFLWKWFPNMQGHEGYPERDYTPQGKIGEVMLRKWYTGKE